VRLPLPVWFSLGLHGVLVTSERVTEPFAIRITTPPTKGAAIGCGKGPTPENACLLGGRVNNLRKTDGACGEGSRS
jgi:hypothetical protein